MTDKEILQGIDKLEDGIPFDEIRNGDKWLDIHELLSEIRERINPWHYPSRGELPEKIGYYWCCLTTGYPDEKYYEEVRWSGEYWIIDEYEQVIAWQDIISPHEGMYL